MSTQDSSFTKNFAVVLGILAAIAVVFYVVAGIVVGASGANDRSQDPMMQAKIEENLAPIGSVRVAGEAPAAAAAPAATQVAAGPRSGADIYNSVCVACHASGVAGAPKLGDHAAWTPRQAQGLETLVAHATSGLNAMPPKGTCADCSDEELRSAIRYMLGESGFDAGAETAAAPAAAPEPVASSAGAGQGQQLYNSTCMACHSTGAAGAPKVGDSTAWAPRIAKGMDTLLSHAVNGFNAMPPKGTCVTCSEGDLQAAIEYMVANSQ